MIDRIVLSADGTTAYVVYPHRTVSYYCSEGLVWDLVIEMLVGPIEMQERSEEVTEVVNLEELEVV